MRSPKRPNPQAAVDAWNARHPVGTPVTLRKDGGEIVEGVTTCAAYVLSGHSAVIFVSGVRGCYALDRVTPKPDVLSKARGQADELAVRHSLTGPARADVEAALVRAYAMAAGVKP